MRDSFSWLTPKQAAELAGYTARHIQNLITSGKLSATRDDGKYYIDKSEFFRVFPDAHRKEQMRNPSQMEADKKRLEFENELLKDFASKKDKEIEFLRSQMEFISNEKVKMLDAIVNQTKFLEHKNDGEIGTKKKGWKSIFKGKKD